jgi:cephalosporin-C deacetylase-like acetyl esterase
MKVTGFFVLFAACLAGANAQQLTFTPLHSSGVCELGETAGWTVTRSAGAADTTKYEYVIRKNNLDVIGTGTLDFSAGTAAIEAKLNEPAMLYVDVTPTKPAVHLGAAIGPWKLAPSAPRPADFDAFWDAKLKALSAVPIHPSLTPAAAAKAGVDVYTVKLDSLGSHVEGYLAKPAREGKFPALVIFQWAGVYALHPSWAADRAAEGWLTFDVDSHDLPPDQATGVQNNYQTIGNTDRDASYFLTMYLRDTRAIDYISTRPDWDGKTIVVMGTSMGGQQSLCAAGLNPKVTAVLVNEPAGADTNGDLHGRKAGYPNWPSNDPKVMATALYFDPVNFAARIQAPVLAAMGFIDTAAPPAGVWTVLNQIPGPKEAVPMVDSAHNNITPDKQAAWESRSKEVLALMLNGGKFEPKMPHY